MGINSLKGTCNKMWKRILRKTDKNLHKSSYTKGETVQQESKNQTARISNYENFQTKAPLKIKVDIEQNILCHSDQMYKLDFRKKGMAVIINNWMFDDSDSFPKRQGANVDALNLGNLFGKLGFEVLHHENMDRIKMAKTMISLSETVVENAADLVIVCILSYEGETGRPLSSDGYEIDIEVDVFRRFNNDYCGRMRGKPKLFIIHTQRVSEMEEDTSSHTPTGDVTEAVPFYSKNTRSEKSKSSEWEDMIIVYSKIPSNMHYREQERDSVAIETICEVFMKHAKSEDLRALLNMVSYQITLYNDQLYSYQKFYFEERGFKKKLYFNPGMPTSTKHIDKDED